MKSWTKANTVALALGASSGFVAGQLAKAYKMDPDEVESITIVTAYIVAWVTSTVLDQ